MRIMMITETFKECINDSLGEARKLSFTTDIRTVRHRFFFVSVFMLHSYLGIMVLLEEFGIGELLL